jgi:dihydroorotate dehydrogenase (fumarate)
MIDLSTSYLGLELKNPLVASSSPLGYSLTNIREFEDCGAAAVVLPSLFEEQLELEGVYLSQNLNRGAESFPEALSYFPDLDDYNISADRYLSLIGRAKEAVSIPIIGSLNGNSDGGWVRFAREIERSGADALELNIYYLPTSPDMSAEDVEQMYCQLVRSVAESVKIPIAVKLGPYFSSMTNMARKLVDCGADGLVIFNRFYQPDFDLEQLEVTPSLTLSTSQELHLRLHWAAVLFGQIEADLAVTGGVHTAVDVLKAMMAGARVAMMTSALLLHGAGHFCRVREDLVRWMEEHDYDSIRQMQGSMSRRAAANPEAFERANYIKVLSSYAVKYE